MTFDGNNNAIEDGTYTTTAVRVVADNVVVKDLTTREVGTAVKLSGSTNSRVENVNVADDSASNGIPSTDGSAIIVSGGSGNEIRNNFLADPGDSPRAHGIVISGSTSNKVVNNDVNAPTGAGIKLVTANNNNISANVIDAAGIGSRFSRAGIQIGEIGTGASDNNYIYDNEINGNGFGGGLPELKNGILAYNGTGNEFDTNTIRDAAQAAIVIDDDSTKLVDTFITDTGEDGIIVTTDSSNTNITDSTVQNSGVEDGSPGISDSGSSTKIIDNTIKSGGGPGLSISDAGGAPTVSENIIRFNDGWAVNINNTPQLQIDDLSLGPIGDPVTVSSISGKDFAIDTTNAPGADLPTGEQDIGIFLNTDTNGGNIDDIRVNYSDSDVASLDESSLRMWSFDSGWTQASGTNDVTPDDNVVFADPPDTDVVLAPLLTNQLPSATASVSPTSLAPSESVSLNASGSVDTDGQIVSYEWDVDGDGTYDTQTTSPTITHSYSQTGSYGVTLRVTDDGDDTDTESVTVSVTEQPIANLSASLTPTSVDANTRFNASNSTFAFGDISEYKWDFTGDGNVDETTTSASTNHTYTSIGEYLPTVTAIGDDGSTAKTSLSLTVKENLLPRDTDGISGVTNTCVRGFINTNCANWVGDDVSISVQNIEDIDGQIVEYKWDFDGDGVTDQTSSSSRVTHAYTQTGTYTVSVDIVDDDGAVRTETKDITITQRKSGTIAGNITDASTGDDLDETPVILYDSNIVVNKTLTNASGGYNFTDVAADSTTYNVTVDPPGYEAGYQEVTVSDNTVTMVDLALQPEPSTPADGDIQFNVDASDATAIEGATVKVKNRTGVVATATTDAVGYATVSVPDNYYVVDISSDGYESKQVLSAVEAGKTTYVSPTLETVPESSFDVSIDSTNEPVTEGRL
ncbi:PKD domain-containing protein [Halovenus salina]|uniref:PKD domain-containing protein n=1 Tax=Halovenus salina TaxID=1510225 RepID=A0ABD5W1F9_9EURY